MIQILKILKWGQLNKKGGGVGDFVGFLKIGVLNKKYFGEKNGKKNIKAPPP